jgi:Fe-S cluster assembly iron-binding protein IscA
VAEWKSILDECRRLFAPRPSPSGVIVPRDLRIECAGDDLPWDLVPGYQQLLNHGRVVWGARVQSNYRAQAPGEGDLPGMSLWSPDRYFDDRPGELSSIASTLYAWRDGPMPPPDPAAAEAIRILDDEHDHVIRLPLPPSLTGGRVVFMGMTVYCRRQLPAGFLVERIYPLLVWPERVSTHLILPLKWWPPRLIEQSRAAAARKLAELEREREQDEGQEDSPQAAAPSGLRVAPSLPPLPPPQPSGDKPSPGTPAPPAPAPPPPLPAVHDPAACRRYLQNPVRLTPAAAAELREVIRQTGMTPYAFVRVALEPRPAGGWTRTVHLNQNPLQPGRDLFQESEGLTVVVESRFAAELRGYVVDVADRPAGRGLVLRPPSV